MNSRTAKSMIKRMHIISLLAVCFVALIFGKCEMTLDVYDVEEAGK